MNRHRDGIKWTGGHAAAGRRGGVAGAVAALGVLVGVLAAAAPEAAADASPPREAQLKAAFLYNFAQFTEWPAEAFSRDAPALVIGVLGAADPLQGAMEAAVGGRVVNGRKIVVRHFATPDDVRACHVLYVGDLSGADLPRVRERLGGSAALVVGDAESFMDAGGTIRLFTEGNRMRFEISARVAEQAGLRISAKLLKLARLR